MKSSLRQCGSFSLFGMAMGAGLMYLLDSSRRLRRHTTRVAQPRSEAPRHPSVPDWVLAERARLEVWRTIANPDSIQICARQGRLTLWGPVLAEEPEKLREKLAMLPGLRQLDLQFTTREEPVARVA